MKYRLPRGRRSRPTPRFRRRSVGFTLIEVVASMLILSVVMVAIGSTIVLASRVIPSGDLQQGKGIHQAKVLQRIAEDLSAATRFIDRTMASVTFLVADRNDDGNPEQLTYSWSTIAGEPLRLKIGNASAAVLLSDVQKFHLDYIIEPRLRPARVLVVCASPGGTSSADRRRIDRVASFGNRITLIEAEAAPGAYAAVAADVDVALIPLHVPMVSVSTKLKNVPIGVVSEAGALASGYGFSTDASETVYDDQIHIVDATHEVTRQWAIGELPISTQPVLSRLRGTLAPGATVLARTRNGAKPVLIAIEKGTLLADGETAAGRRMQLPWSAGRCDAEALTIEGMTLAERAIDWAASNDVMVAVGIALRSGDGTTPLIKTQSVVVNRPPVVAP